MRNDLDGDVTRSYRMNTQFMLNMFCVGLHLAVSHKHNSNSLAAIFHINKSNAAGNSKSLYTRVLYKFIASNNIQSDRNYVLKNT